MLQIFVLEILNFEQQCSQDLELNPICETGIEIICDAFSFRWLKDHHMQC